MSDESEEVVRIGLVTRASLEQSLEFIRKQFLRRFATNPTTPEILFAAYRGYDVVGAIALDFAQGKEPMPFEVIYAFDPTRCPWPYHRETLAQYGRWTAVVPGVSTALILAATLYALAQGKILGVCIAKKNASSRIMSFGINLVHITESRIIEENVPFGDRSYYLTPPEPKLYMTELQQAALALQNEVAPLFSSGSILFQ